MSDLVDRLKSKGWTDDDIQKAVSIIEQSRKKEPKNMTLIKSIIYWAVLFVGLIGNFVISIILIPFMLAIPGLRLIVIILIIGFAFGAFFDMLIRDLRSTENKDIVIAGIFLPLLALINVSLMVEFANYLEQKLGLLTGQHNPWLISVTYVFAFVLPHVIQMMMDYKERKVLTSFK